MFPPASQDRLGEPKGCRGSFLAMDPPCIGNGWKTTWITAFCGPLLREDEGFVKSDEGFVHRKADGKFDTACTRFAATGDIEFAKPAERPSNRKDTLEKESVATVKHSSQAASRAYYDSGISAISATVSCCG